MKKRLEIPCLVVLLIACCGFQDMETTPQDSVSRIIQIPFSGDSGFIVRQQCTDFLWRLKLIDREEKNALTGQLDTLGRFFRSPVNGHYILCVSYDEPGDFGTHVLVELEAINGNKCRVVAKEQYLHGNYACCWDNNWEGFTLEHNGYFSLRYCGTGSGFCSASTYYFKTVQAQDSLERIRENYIFLDELGSKLTSTKSWDGNTLVHHYLWHAITYVESGENDGDWIPSGDIDSFTIRYHFQKDKWWTSDTIYLKQLMF